MRKIGIVFHSPEVITYYYNGNSWRQCRIKEEDFFNLNDIASVDIYISGLKNTLRVYDFNGVDAAIVYFSHPDIAIDIAKKLNSAGCLELSLDRADNSFGFSISAKLDELSATSGIFNLCGVLYAAENYSEKGKVNLRRLSETRRVDAELNIESCFSTVASVLSREASSVPDAESCDSIMTTLFNKWVSSDDKHLNELYQMMNVSDAHSHFDLMFTLCKALTLSEIPEEQWETYRNGRPIANDFGRIIGGHVFYKIFEKLMKTRTSINNQLKECGQQEKFSEAVKLMVTADELLDHNKASRIMKFAESKGLAEVWMRWKNGQ